MTPVDQMPVIEGELMDIEPEEESEAELYWAKKDASEVISVLQGKEARYFQHIERRGFKSMWRRMWAQYFGQDQDSMSSFDSQTISIAGEDGELLSFRMNEVRPLVERQLQMICGERAAFQCQATNSDYATKAQINSCDAFVEYSYRKAHAERKEVRVAESDIVFGSGAGWVRWDADRGDNVEVIEQVQVPNAPPGTMAPVPTMKKSGQPTVTALFPWEDFKEVSTTAHLWRCPRERRSKWELLAQYPELAEKIRGQKGLDEYTTEALFGFTDDQDGECDELIVKHFYHERCAAMPNGRYLGYVGDVVLWDLPCPVSEGLPIVEMMSTPFIGTSLGYAAAWELIAPTQMQDQITSDVASNLATFGRQVIGVYDGTKFDVDALANGHRVLNLPASSEAPVALNFSAIPEAAQWMLSDYLPGARARLSAVNEAAQGNPEAMVKSGTYAALLHSIAIEGQAPRQTAFDSYRETMANLLLDMVRQRASAPFMIDVAGKEERPYLQEFTKDTLSGVKRVVVKTANPMMRSQAGRLEIYNAVKAIPNPADRAAAIELIVSGNSKDFAKTERSEDMAITWENEQLAEGIPCPVLYSDKHDLHWKKHKAELDARRAEVMANPDALTVIVQHMMEHETTYAQMTNPIVSEWNQMLPAPMYRGLPTGPAANTQMAPEGAMGGTVDAAQTAGAGAPPSDPAAQAGAEQPEPAQPPGEAAA